MMRVEAVGRWYESHVSHMTGAGGGGAASVGDSSSDEDDCSAGGRGSAGRGDKDGSPSGADINPLLLDPTQWKVIILLL